MTKILWQLRLTEAHLRRGLEGWQGQCPQTDLAMIEFLIAWSAKPTLEAPQ